MAGRWLLKTEPEEWSWEHQQANGGISQWDGVRNALAQKHLRAMELGDLCLFYHSGSKAKEIVGIARVCKTFHPDPTDSLGKHGMVDIEAVSKLSQPLALARLKEEDGLRSFLMFRQPRLSVVPVAAAEWNLICELAGQLDPPFLPGMKDDRRVDLNDRILEHGNEEAGDADAAIASETELKPALIRRKADARARSIKTALCDNETDARAKASKSAQCDNETDDDVPNVIGVSSHIKKQRSKRKAVTDVNKLKDNVPPLPVACSPASRLQQHDVELNSVAQDNSLRSGLEEPRSPMDVKEDRDACISPHSFTKKVAKVGPNAKKVYSRRGRKQGKVEPLHINAEIDEDLACRNDLITS